MEKITAVESGIADVSNGWEAEADSKGYFKFKIRPIVGTLIVESVERDILPQIFLMVLRKWRRAMHKRMYASFTLVQSCSSG